MKADCWLAIDHCGSGSDWQPS